MDHLTSTLTKVDIFLLSVVNHTEWSKLKFVYGHVATKLNGTARFKYLLKSVETPKYRLSNKALRLLLFLSKRSFTIFFCINWNSELAENMLKWYAMWKSSCKCCSNAKWKKRRFVNNETNAFVIEQNSFFNNFSELFTFGRTIRIPSL